MIQSDTECQLALVQLDRFHQALEHWQSTERPEDQHPLIHQAFGDALRSQIETLTEETIAWKDYVHDLELMSRIAREQRTNAGR